jgi:hypothetical protein
MANEVITRIEVNCETGVTTVIPLTPEEIAEIEAQAAIRQAELEEIQATQEAEAVAKAAGIEKLAALGLTTEEIAALTK